MFHIRSKNSGILDVDYLSLFGNIDFEFRFSNLPLSLNIVSGDRKFCVDIVNLERLISISYVGILNLRIYA